MKNDLAEFHDIGKLIDWNALGLQARDPHGNFSEKEPHDFEKCKGSEWEIKFSSPVWEAIFRKDVEVVRDNYSKSLAWVFVSVADQLAAGLGRLREEAIGGPPQYGYHCLWTGKDAPDLRLKNAGDLKELIRYLNENPSWGATDRRYQSNLYSRAESARPGLNVTTLRSHSILTGKLFRVLQPIAATTAQNFSSYPDALNALGSLRLTVVFVRILFPQRPFRTRDLSVFQQRREIVRTLLSRYERNILVSYGENLLTLFPSREDADRFMEEVTGQHFVAVIRTGEKTLADMRSIGIERVLKREEELFTKTLPPEIRPPLCEGCQMAPGDHHWPADFLADRDDLTLQTRATFREQPWAALRAEHFPNADQEKLAEWLEEWSEENLCEHCFALRRRAEPLAKLASWQDCTVAWVRVALNLDDLIEALRQLHTAYIETSAREIQTRVLETLPVRFPLLEDFVEDYQHFLEDWRSRLVATFGAESVDWASDDLVAVQMDEQRDALRILQIHNELMAEAFPKLIDLKVAPVRLSLSISPVKFPFFAHWRHLESPEEAVAIHVIGGGTAKIPLKCLGEILQIVGGAERRALHRLRQIARTSKVLAEILLGDRQDRDHRAFGQLQRITPLQVDFESLVTLVNLAER